jgi:gamma-glutamyltranspeptidase/glutathione hydrolase
MTQSSLRPSRNVASQRPLTTTALPANFPYAFACPAAVLRDGELNMGCTEIMVAMGDAVPEGLGR